MTYLGKNSRQVKELRRRVRRRLPGEVIVDGTKLIGDLLRWGIGIKEVYLTSGMSQTAEAESWIDSAGEVFELDDETLASVAPTRTPQGVLAVVEEPEWPVWVAAEGVGLYLQGVQDPGNLGAIIRSAAALGAAAVLLSPGCADPFGPTAVRGSAGSVFRIPIERNVEVLQAAKRVSLQGGEIWATGSEGVPFAEWRPPKTGLLMLGAEGQGLSPEALAAAPSTVTIPLQREVESLNVAVAAGILLATLPVSS